MLSYMWLNWNKCFDFIGSLFLIILKLPSACQLINLCRLQVGSYLEIRRNNSLVTLQVSGVHPLSSAKQMHRRVHSVSQQSAPLGFTLHRVLYNCTPGTLSNVASAGACNNNECNLPHLYILPYNVLYQCRDM